MYPESITTGYVSSAAAAAKGRAVISITAARIKLRILFFIIAPISVLYFVLNRLIKQNQQLPIQIYMPVFCALK